MNLDLDEPIVETTVYENIIIKKFLNFALKDVQYQILKLEESNLPKKKLQQNLVLSECIREYLHSLINSLDVIIDPEHTH
jgi:hypothetical protein